MNTNISSRAGHRRALALALSALLTAGTGVAVAAPPPDAGSDAIAQKVGQEMRLTMLDLIQSGALGPTNGQDISLDIDTPAEQVTTLGVLVDSASPKHARDGLHVLAVTPGSSADQMGLRAGDILTAIDGRSLVALGADGKGHAAAAGVLRDSVAAMRNGERIDFGVVRDGRNLSVGGNLRTVYVPAMHLMVGSAVAAAGAAATAAADPPQGCGRISAFDVAPRQQHLHAAVIIAIDGVAPGPQGTPSFRVDAGEHTLTVAENIESQYISFSDAARNAGLAGSKYKKLTIDVQPDMTYLVAARLNPDQRNNPSHGAYWDPVMWKAVPESCR